MLVRVVLQSVLGWRDLKDRSSNPRLRLTSDLVLAAVLAGFWWLISIDLFSLRVASFDLAALITGAGCVALLFMAATSLARSYAPGNVQLQGGLKTAAVGFWVISIAAFTVVRWLLH